jgi:hypothetical protein
MMMQLTILNNGLAQDIIEKTLNAWIVKTCDKPIMISSKYKHLMTDIRNLLQIVVFRSRAQSIFE